MAILTRGAFARPGTSLDFKTGDWRLQRPVHLHRDAPCHSACPAGEDPQAYLARVAEGDLKAAWETLVGANPLPAITGRVCHHPCEAQCNRGQFDEPIAIHGVERFLGDEAIRNGWNYPLPDRPPHPREVAVVGAGPAGLAAAYHLVGRGYDVSLFEADPQAGGLLRSAIAPYRLPRAVLDAEVERLLSVGIRFLAGQRLGRDFMLDELQRRFPAVLLAIGAERGRAWSANGVIPHDLRTGLGILKEWMSLGRLPSYSRVAIIGGGNTAIDLARVLKFAGVSEVHVVTFQAMPLARGHGENPMSAAPREIAQALEEGVIIHHHRGVRRLILRGEQVVGVEMIHMKELARDGGRREVVGFEGTETVLHVDHVIPAIGQEVEPAGLEFALVADGFLHPDAWGALANHPGLFAGGDARGGAGSVSRAIGDGRRAAQAIDAHLRSMTPEAPSAAPPIALRQLNLNYFERAPRAQTPILEPKQRTAENEIEAGLSHAQVTDESHRCFSCGECLACDNCWTLCPDNAALKTTELARDGSHYVFDYDYCKGCGLCAHECPPGFIIMKDEA